MYQAIQLGFCARSMASPQISTTRRVSRTIARSPIGIVATGLMYNTRSSPRRAGRRRLLERSQGSEVPEAARHSADQQHLRPGSAADACQNEAAAARPNVDAGFKIFKEQINPTCWPMNLAGQDDRAVPVRPSGAGRLGDGPCAELRQHRLPRRLRLSKEGAATLLTPPVHAKASASRLPRASSRCCSIRKSSS